MSSSAAQSAESAIRALDTKFMANAAAGDARTLVDDFYAEDAQLLPPGSPIVAGKEAIHRMWQATLHVAGDLKLDTQQIEVCGDLAYAVGQYSMKSRVPGQAETEQKGKYLVVYRRSDGDWKAVADMFSPNS